MRNEAGRDIAKANMDGDVLSSYHTHWAKQGSSYTVNEYMDFAIHGDTVYASKGPSEQDISIVAGFFKGDQLLIDYRNVFIYNTSSTYGHIPPVNVFIWRFFPTYLVFY